MPLCRYRILVDQSSQNDTSNSQPYSRVLSLVSQTFFPHTEDSYFAEIATFNINSGLFLNLLCILVMTMSTLQRPLCPIAAATPKPLLRRSTLVRKRDDDDEAPPSSPGKKPKVRFDSDVEVRVVSDWEKAPHVILEEVRRAFAKRALGDDSGYDKLRNVYSRDKDKRQELSPSTIKNYTIALLANVSALNKSNCDLVHTVLSSDWLGRSEDYVIVYVRLLAAIVSAQGIFLEDVVRMLVNNLTAGESRSLQPLETSLNVYQHLHHLFK